MESWMLMINYHELLVKVLTNWEETRHFASVEIAGCLKNSTNSTIWNDRHLPYNFTFTNTSVRDKMPLRSTTVEDCPTKGALQGKPVLKMETIRRLTKMVALVLQRIPHGMNDSKNFCVYQDLAGLKGI